MNAVTPGASAHHDNRIAGLGIFFDLVSRDDPDAAAKDQGVADVIVVEIDGPVDGWNSHPIAVIANAGHDLLKNSFGMNDALWEISPCMLGAIWVCNAKDVSIGDRFCSQASS